MSEQDTLRASLVAWLRLHSPNYDEWTRVPPECRPLLEAMSRVSGAQAVARLADEIEAGPSQRRKQP